MTDYAAAVPAFVSGAFSLYKQLPDGKNPKQTGGHAASQLNVSGIAAGRQIERKCSPGSPL